MEEGRYLMSGCPLGWASVYGTLNVERGLCLTRPAESIGGIGTRSRDPDEMDVSD